MSNGEFPEMIARLPRMANPFPGVTGWLSQVRNLNTFCRALTASRTWLGETNGPYSLLPLSRGVRVT